MLLLTIPPYQSLDEQWELEDLEYSKQDVCFLIFLFCPQEGKNVNLVQNRVEKIKSNK